MTNKNFKKVIIVVLIIFVLAFSVFAFFWRYVTKTNLPDTAQRNPQIKEAYLFALAHPEILEKIPCYCGCANMGHMNNKDCYFDSEGNFIEHGSLCGGCTGITLDVKRLYLQNKSIKEIRSFIDKKYHGTGTPTPTSAVE